MGCTELTERGLFLSNQDQGDELIEAATAAHQHEQQHGSAEQRQNDYRTCADFHICLSIEPRWCVCVRWELGLNGFSPLRQRRI